MTRSAEEEARRYLRLFPRWMREVRGEEAIGLVLDQLPPDAGRLPVRSKVDLTRAGLHAQRIGRPPHKVRRTVASASPRSRGGTVPPEWRPWLLDGLPRRSFAFTCAMTRNWHILVLGILWAAPYGARSGAGWDPWGAVLAVGLWILTSALAALRVQRWRDTLSVRNGLRPDGSPLPLHQTDHYWTRAAISNVWVLPGLMAGAAVHAGAAALGWPDIGSPGNGILAFWLVIAALVGAWLLGVDRLAQERMAPAPPASPRLLQPAGGGWSAGMVIGALVGLLAAALISWIVGVVAGILGLATLARWVLCASAAIVSVRAVEAERRQSRRIGLWDLFRSTGPQIVNWPEPLPPPPDEQDRPALG